MKFIFADCMDMVDPAYNFIEDRSSPNRRLYWDEVYPHEILGFAPYSGMLVSRAIVGDHRKSGYYTASQAMRFRREGARAFLRLDTPQYSHLDVFGDCGAFSYVKEDVPPYTPENMVEFYDQGGFTHGCSVDHIIFDFDLSLRGMEGGSADARRRFDITLENADVFLKASQYLSGSFIPMGVIQAWSPDSMAEAARRLVKMGYKYLALGGVVPLTAEQIRQCLSVVRNAIPSNINIHILGFAKADEIESFLPYNITSFDSTSPLIRAFKDDKNNYFVPAPGRKLQYYTAIRVPQSLANLRLQKLVKMGTFKSEELETLEISALKHLRAYDIHEADLEQTLEAVLTYNSPLVTELPYEEVRSSSKKMKNLEALYRRTLTDRAWKNCQCPICKAISIEVIIFRASNRNRRRGIHNLAVYNGIIDQLNLIKVPQ